MVQAFSITEPQVVAQLNAGRFEGEIEGFVVMEGASYLGYMLFCKRDKLAEILESSIENQEVLDFVLRACLCKCLRLGAVWFCMRTEQAALQAFWRDSVGVQSETASIDVYLTNTSCCKACTQKCDKNGEKLQG